ncbi:MAG TPA: GAF domain-containing protein [Steroidobacteraceae bacterium]|jgi:L-methionine (R)-S-oxide reductase|nr:GAF domain-containing protein [Steroidobacteraceae bacterium]
MREIPDDSGDLLALTDGVLAGERDPWANAANAAALVYERMPDLNWAGFYFLRGGGLVVGPFQGRVACVRIPLGQGVCGTAAERRATLIVPDVHRFPGHIACDAASNSEVVVPLVEGGRLIGVLDLDSPRFDRFTAADARLLESLVEKVVAACDWRLAGIDGY